jgi:hypothetical protein
MEVATTTPTAIRIRDMVARMEEKYERVEVKEIMKKCINMLN